MINVTVCIGARVNFQFIFKTKDAADAAYKNITDYIHPQNRLTIADDYGNTANFRAEDISAVVVEDLDKSGDARVERSIYEARLQAKVQTKANADPALRFAAGNGGMPPGPRIHA